MEMTLLNSFSCEPLIGPLNNLTFTTIDWAIVSGESGRKSRPMDESWVWGIKQQSENSGTAFFFIQWGGVNKKRTGRLLCINTYDAMPAKVFLIS